MALTASLTKIIRPVTSSTARAISTTASKNHNAEALILDRLPASQCPFRSTINTIESLLHKEPVSETQSTVRPFSEIPGPKGLPIVGTLFDYFKKGGLSFNKMFEAYRQRSLEFGPIYKEKIATISTVVISDPDEYAKVMRSEGKHPNRREMEPMVHYRTKKGYGLGLVNSQGEEWHKYRSVLSKKMLKLKDVQDYCDSMSEVANDFVDSLHAARGSNGEVPNLDKQLFKWTMESIGTVLFEERIGCFQHPMPEQAAQFIDNLVGYFKLMQPLMYNLPIYKVYETKLWKQFENYADNVMALGQSYVDKKMDVLKRQLDAGVKDGETEEKSAFLTYMLTQDTLTPTEVSATMVDMMMAAVETTANATIWTLYCLAKNPDAQEILHKELSQVLPNKGEIKPESLAKLSYVKACLRESFRMYPITFATSRVVQEDVEVAGYNIPAGTHVQANVYGMGRDENIFPEPMEYRPERWLRSQTDTSRSTLSNLIWGHGARMCIGRRIAEQEIYIALSKIVQNFRLEYHHEDVEPTLNTVMTPDRSVKIKFIPRT